MSSAENYSKLRNSLHTELDKLQISWAIRLQFDFDVFNYHFLSKKISKPTFKFFENSTQWGYWKGGQTREIGINLQLIFDHPWETVLIVLKHEMAHQFVDEAMGGSQDPHGDKFRKACQLLSIPFHAACSYPVNQSDTQVESSILRKIKKMFALAESSNENEARTAMVMANNLLLKHNLSKSDIENKKEYSHKYVGDVMGRTPVEFNIISSILTEYFFVLTIWTFSYDALSNKKGSRLEICGSPENVEISEYVYYYLINQLEYLWKKYKSENKISHQKYRKSFVLGVLRGFREKLQLDRADCQERGLVWKGDPELNEFYRQLHPKIKSVSSGGHLLYEEASNDGYSKGKNLKLHLGIKNSGGFGGHIT